MNEPRAFVGVGGMLLLALALSGCDDRHATAAPKPVDPPPAARAAIERIALADDEMRRAGLTVERLEWRPHKEIVALFGTVEANRDRLARVLPPIAGRLAQVRANLGELVAPGDVLAVLDSPELGEIRATHHQALTELTLAKAAHERAQRLVGDGSIAQKDVLRAKSDHDKALAGLNMTASKLASLGVPAAAPPGTSPTALAVPAPFAGTIVEKPAVLGEYAQAYQPLFTLADLSSLWIEVTLYDRDIGEVAVGAPATVSIAAYPERRFAGRVNYISSLVDRETRTVKARIELANDDGRLKPGMFANVLIEKAAADRRLRLPETALVLLYGQLTAFVATPSGFEPRPVEMVERANGQVTIASGLEAGEQVVTAGVYALKARLLASQLSSR
jgi:cobalt-zinc-cadmium efflux system membrane fusion protein